MKVLKRCNLAAQGRCKVDLEGSDLVGKNISYYAIAIIKAQTGKDMDWVGTVKIERYKSNSFQGKTFKRLKKIFFVLGCFFSNLLKDFFFF